MACHVTAYPDTFYARTAIPFRPRPRLEGDGEADVCIVGAGLAGITAALELARAGLSVVVLEGERIAWGASGRNGGFVEAGFAEETGRLVETAGAEAARALYGLSAEGAAYVARAIKELGLAGVDPAPGWLRVTRTDNEAAMRRSEALHREVLGHALEFWATDKVRTHLKSPRYFQGLYDPDAFHIHPLNYALGLAGAAENAGAAIHEESRAVAIETDAATKRVRTGGGSVKAGHVVLCASATMGQLYPGLWRAILPVATYIAVTRPFGARLGAAVNAGFAVTDTRRAGNYYRIVGGDRLLWGGAITTRVTEPGNLAGRMQADLLSVYPQLAPAEIDVVWSGLMAYAVHKMPLIGEIEPGIWTATAFGGHGLNTTAMAGNLVAGAIAAGDDRWRLFEPYRARWGGGPLGRAATQGAYWYYRARDWWDERNA